MTSAPSIVHIAIVAGPNLSVLLGGHFSTRPEWVFHVAPSLEHLTGVETPSPDLVIVDANPLENFKVLYGTGAVKLNDKTGQVDHVAGIKYTVKNGIVYDAKQLLADVAKMVDDQKKSRAVVKK